MKVFEETLNLTGICEAQTDAAYTAYIQQPRDFDQDSFHTKEEYARPAVIICPGGAYSHLAPKEGEPVALQFLDMGCQAFVLRYSLTPDHFPVSLLEVGLLIKKIRENADEWQVDPNRIAILGFSAGGHLAASFAVFWDKEFVWKTLNTTAEAIRPNALLLCYPVITSGTYCHEESIDNLLGSKKDDADMRRLVSLELQAGPQVPPAFIWHTVADALVPVENSLLFADALLKNGVSVELHIFPEGRHGLALANVETSKGLKEYVVPGCQVWIDLAKSWLRNLFSLPLF